MTLSHLENFLLFSLVISNREIIEVIITGDNHNRKYNLHLYFLLLGLKMTFKS